MFLKNILNEEEYILLLDKYDNSFFDSVPLNTFTEIYNFLKSKKVFFINDLIVNYLEMFTLNVNVMKEAFDILKSKYGNDYLYYIGENLKILDETIEQILER